MQQCGSSKRKQDEESEEKDEPTGRASMRCANLSLRDSKKRRRPFWKNGIIYQIYPRSFCDSNEDGIGDLQGIRSKINYFVELGVDMVWLSPVFESPMKDFGYDISDFEKIDPIFGSMEDFEQLVRDMHAKDLKVILDFVPNHTSDQHEWFLKSLERDPKYDDYYIWRDPIGFDETGAPIPPNNWVSVFRFSAWEWSDKRQQFYYHQFLKEQPDLNYRNPDVIEDMNNVLRFWLDKGVDGFRVDSVKHLVEIEDVYGADEPPSENCEVEDPTQYDYFSHVYTVNQPETFDVIRGWRKIIDEYSERVLLVEVYEDDVSELMKYYGDETDPLADFPFNFFFITNFKNRNYVTGFSLKANVDLWLKNLPSGKWPNWVTGNHDQKRVASRLGKDLVDALNIFILLLPGTPVTYYGEEIGMEDSFISYEDTQDPWGRNMGEERYTEISRDPARTPMQWDNSKFSGFTKGNTTWVPVNENHQTLNVQSQRENKQSHLNIYKSLSRLRKEKAFQMGTLEFHLVTEEVVAYIRYYEGEARYMVVVNTSTKEVLVDLRKGRFYLPDFATIILRSTNDLRPETSVGSEVDLTQVSMLAGEGFVLVMDG